MIEESITQKVCSNSMMHRTALLSIVLLVLTGCSSSHVFKGELNGAASIAGTESFYVFACDTVSGKGWAHPRFSLTRLEADGSSRMIREIEGSLWIVDRLATDTALVVERNGDNTRYLYSVASGEMSVLPKDYQYKPDRQSASDRTRDSLRKTPLLKDIDLRMAYHLSEEDIYLIEADVPGAGGSNTIQEMDRGSFSPGCFSMPDSYLLVADMKRNTLTNLGGGRLLCFSTSQKNILVQYYEGRSDQSRVVSIAHVLER